MTCHRIDVVAWRVGTRLFPGGPRGVRHRRRQFHVKLSSVITPGRRSVGTTDADALCSRERAGTGRANVEQWSGTQFGMYAREDHYGRARRQKRIHVKRCLNTQAALPSPISRRPLRQASVLRWLLSQAERVAPYRECPGQSHGVPARDRLDRPGGRASEAHGDGASGIGVRFHHRCLPPPQSRLGTRKRKCHGR